MAKNLTFSERHARAAKARARKFGLASHAFLTRADVRAVNGNAWEAAWFVARAGEAYLDRDGIVYETTQAAMGALPSFKNALLRRNLPPADYREWRSLNDRHARAGA